MRTPFEPPPYPFTARPAPTSRALAACLALSLAGPALAQTTWHVDVSAAGPGTGTTVDPFPSIQTAIDQPSTVDGDTVLVHPGTYHEFVDMLDKELALVGSGGSTVTTVDVSALSQPEMSAIKIRNGQGPACRVEGLSFVGGNGTPVLDPTFGTQVYGGGGLLAIDSSPTLVDCVFRDSTPQVGGGALVIGGAPVFEGCTFAGNSTNSWGGGLSAAGAALTLRNTVVRDNKTWSGDGGGVHLFGGSLVLEDSTLIANLGGGAGRGSNMALRGGATAVVSGTTIALGNTLDGKGGGVWLLGGAASFEGCTLRANRCGDPVSNQNGGAICAEGATLLLNACVLSGNYSARGGAVFLQNSSATIVGSTFDANRCQSGANYTWAEGGAIAASQSSVTISKSIFSNNVAECYSPGWSATIARGGALWCDTAQVQVTHCAFLSNSAYYNAWAAPLGAKQEAGAQGGAIFGPAFVQRSRLIGNRAWSNPAKLHVWAEGGGAWGSTLVASLLQANVVQGIGAATDIGPAAEACTLGCCTLLGNLPASLPPLGPNCTASCP